MQEECATLFGQIVARLDAEKLAALLGGEVRESSHFAGNRYVRLEHAGANMSFELLPDEVLIRGDAPSQAALAALAELASTALGRAKLRYSLELYAGQLLLDTLSPVRMQLRIDADLCGPISMGTVAVIRVLAEHLGISSDEATALVDRAVFDGESVELELPSRSAAEALASALARLPAGPRVLVSVKP